MALKSFKTYLKEDYIPNHRHEINENIIDNIQIGADVVSGILSFIPGGNLIGSGIDAISAGVDLAQGQYGDAGLRGAAAVLGIIPGVGVGVKVAGAAAKGVKAASVAGKAASVGGKAKSAVSGAANIGKATKETAALGGKVIRKLKDIRQARAAAKEVSQVKTVTKDLLSKGIKDPSIIAKAVDMKVGAGALKRTVKAGRDIAAKEVNKVRATAQNLASKGFNASEVAGSITKRFGSGALRRTVAAGRQVGTKAPGAGLSAAELAAKKAADQSASISKKLLGRGIDPDVVSTAASTATKAAGTGVLGATRARSAALAGKVRRVVGPKAKPLAGPVRALRQGGVAMTRQNLRTQASATDGQTTGSSPQEGPIDRAQVDYLQVRRAGQ